MASLPVDDRDLDDAALWAAIDSAAAASYSSYSSPTTNFRKPCSTLKYSPNFKSPPKPRNLNHSSSSSSSSSFSDPNFAIKNSVRASPAHHDYDFNRPLKMVKSSSSCISKASENSPDLMLVKHSPVNNLYSSPKLNDSPQFEQHRVCQDKENFTHCLSGRYPTVSLFREYQEAAMSILDKSDYIMISGNPFIKKSGWRKIAFYFNVSFEIRDKTINFDENCNVQRAEFVARAYMQGGRFSDGWGSCERREKKFLKPNNDIPSTAETRAKNRACQDLLGIGQYRPGVSQAHSYPPR